MVESDCKRCFELLSFYVISLFSLTFDDLAKIIIEIRNFMKICKFIQFITIPHNKFTNFSIQS